MRMNAKTGRTPGRLAVNELMETLTRQDDRDKERHTLTVARRKKETSAESWKSSSQELSPLKTYISISLCSNQ